MRTESLLQKRDFAVSMLKTEVWTKYNEITEEEENNFEPKGKAVVFQAKSLRKKIIVLAMSQRGAEGHLNGFQSQGRE